MQKQVLSDVEPRVESGGGGEGDVRKRGEIRRGFGIGVDEGDLGHSREIKRTQGLRGLRSLWRKKR